MTPSRPLAHCAIPGCSGKATHGSRCEQHASATPKPTWGNGRPRGTAEERGYGYDWARLRNEIIASRPICERCGQAPSTSVHHIVPIEVDASLRLATYNLAALCERCHRLVRRRRQSAARFADQQVTRNALRERFAARPCDLAKRARQKIVHLIGLPASGKSYLAQCLADTLSLPAYSIDAERVKLLSPGQKWPTPEQDYQAWLSLEAAMDAPSACIVETLGTHPNDGPLLRGRQVLRVLCKASEATRRTRLEERARSGFWLALGNPRYVDDVLRLKPPTVAPDVILDSTSEDQLALDGIMECIGQWVGAIA